MKNDKFFHLKIIIFTAVKNYCVLHRRVIHVVMWPKVFLELRGHDHRVYPYHYSVHTRP